MEKVVQVKLMFPTFPFIAFMQTCIFLAGAILHFVSVSICFEFPNFF